MRALYRIGVSAYHLGVRLAAATGNLSARKWLAGREVPWPVMDRDRPVLWLHAASLGEFEQGRPVLEGLRRARPDYFVVVTFFSPSGYDRCHDTELADAVAYLPRDTPDTARRWVAHLRPDLTVFVKYEFWWHHLEALRRAGCRTYLIAGSFRPDQLFFRPWGTAYRKVLSCFTKLIVQTASDRELLRSAGVSDDRIAVGGDPRMDRTIALAATPFTDSILAAFTADHPTLLAGSVWPADVEVLAVKRPPGWRLVLAPHQLHEAEIVQWTEQFGAVRYSEIDSGKVPLTTHQHVLLLDTIGILSRAYRYGTLAYVGGAFRTGLHNTLEPLAYGLPVIFGPKFHKFPEAEMALRRGGAFTITSNAELEKLWARTQVPGFLEAARRAQLSLRDELAGSAERTLAVILRDE